MKRSADFTLTVAQRHRDRRRVERALGHPLVANHPVHHHSPTQLVVCEDCAYHALLHQRAYAYRLAHPTPENTAFFERQLEHYERATEAVSYEVDLLWAVLEATLSPEDFATLPDRSLPWPEKIAHLRAWRVAAATKKGGR